MTENVDDWRPHITEMVAIKQQLYQADEKGLWQFHYPRVAASEDRLVATEEAAGFAIEREYRRFLGHANGWPSFMLNLDLFGTSELAGGPRMMRARELLDGMGDGVFTEIGFPRSDLCPIAAASLGRDMFVMPVVEGEMQPPVIWISGHEIDRYPSFPEFFVAMIEYNKHERDDARRK